MFTAKFLAIVFAFFLLLDAVLVFNQVSFKNQLVSEHNYSSTSFNQVSRRVNALIPTKTLTPTLTATPTASPTAALKRVVTPLKK